MRSAFSGANPLLAACFTQQRGLQGGQYSRPLDSVLRVSAHFKVYKGYIALGY